MVRLCLILFIAALVAAQAASAGAAPPDLNRYVRTQAGDLPIILSAPHGGALKVPDVDVRRGEGLARGPSGFVASRDGGTEELAQQLAVAIERRFGQKPYTVFARSHRQFLDPNRPPHIAYEDADARTVYDHYHGKLTEYCRDAQTRFRRGLLLDLHGQSSRKDTVFRGTQDGRTIKLLRERFGEVAISGDASLFGLLKTRGWRVHPDPLDGKEQDGYRGGYIVQTYGSHQGYGIDAIQLEFGQDFRSAANRVDTADKLTDALVEYAANYLDIPRPPDSAEPLRSDDRTITVAVYEGAGTSQSRDALIGVLTAQGNLQIRDVTAKEIREGELIGCQVLLHPGGSGSAQGKALGDEGRERVREFVEGGGGYIGVCAGAYLATCDYEWSLGILDAKVVDREHWARGFGDVQLKLLPPAEQILDLQPAAISIYYHQGPLLAPAENPALPDYDELALFDTEIAKNGAPKGVMTGCTAIAAGKYHEGRVLCFSPHPERTPGQQQLLLKAIEWAASASR